MLLIFLRSVKTILLFFIKNILFHFYDKYLKLTTLFRLKFKVINSIF